MESDIIQQITDDTAKFLTQPNAFRSILILITSIIVAYWLSRFVARGIIAVAQIVAVRSDETSDDLRQIRLRQVETYLSVTVAIVRVAVAVVVAYIAWRVFSPNTSNSSIAARPSTRPAISAASTLRTISGAIGVRLGVASWNTLI